MAEECRKKGEAEKSTLYFTVTGEVVEEEGKGKGELFAEMSYDVPGLSFAVG